MNKKGFTLIELLAVLVILALLSIVVSTKGFGLFEDSKKAVAKLNKKSIEDGIKILGLDIDNCENDDYVELVKVINQNSITSCEDLKSSVKTEQEINWNELKSQGYITGSDIETNDYDKIDATMQKNDEGIYLIKVDDSQVSENTIVYVSNSGDDAAKGTQSKPLKTLSKAVNKISNSQSKKGIIYIDSEFDGATTTNNEIVINDGVNITLTSNNNSKLNYNMTSFNLKNNATFTLKNITIIGNINSTRRGFIDSTGKSIINIDNVVVSGDQTNEDNFHQFLVASDSQNISINNLKVENINFEYGLGDRFIMIYNNSNTFSIKNSTFSNINGAGTILCLGGKKGVVDNIIISNCSSSAIEANTKIEISITNSTFKNNTKPIIYVEQNSRTIVKEISNCIFEGNTLDNAERSSAIIINNYIIELIKNNIFKNNIAYYTIKNVHRIDNIEGCTFENNNNSVGTIYLVTSSSYKKEGWIGKINKIDSCRFVEETSRYGTIYIETDGIIDLIENTSFINSRVFAINIYKGQLSQIKSSTFKTDYRNQLINISYINNVSTLVGTLNFDENTTYCGTTSLINTNTNVINNAKMLDSCE